MIDFKIIVQSQDKTESTVLDMFGDVGINVIFNISDIRSPESIKSNYTKEFTIPATKANNQFFEGLLYNGFYPTKFNPNLKIDCQLMADDNTIIDGYLQVTDINKNQNDVDSYSVIIYGELASIFNDLGNLRLRDLDFSEYNHTWNYANVVNSWDNYIQKDNQNTNFLLGRGYVYPFEWRGQSDTTFTVEDFLPAMYVKTIFDKVFSWAGKSYKSEFLNSDKFKRLILPYIKSHVYLSQDEVDAREFLVHKSSDELLATMPMTIAQTSKNFLAKFNIEDNDPSNVFTSQHTYTSNYKQNSSIASNLKLKVTYKPSTPQPSGFFVTGPFMKANVYLYDGTLQQTVHTETVEFKHAAGVVGLLGTNYTVSADVFLDYSAIIQKNHSYRIYISYTVPSGPNASKLVNTLGQAIGGNALCYLAADSDMYLTVQEKWLYEGDIMDMNQILPENVKVTDFLTSINKMFNLFWLPQDDGSFKIEPRDDMYSDADVQILDWTYKTDRNEQITISPLQELNNKEYKFSYKEDSDHYNDTYLTENDKIYGERTISVVNDFVTNTQEVKLIFSPSPLVQFKNTQRVCNAYVEYVDGFFESYEPNLRISVYGGMKSSSSNPWVIKSETVPAGITWTTYPYAGHYDDPTNPTYDINYGKCDQYYYGWSNTTTGNLYNQYWENSIRDIIAVDSHIWKGKLYMKVYDIIELNLFDTIQMDGVFYKINKIDYNPLTEIADVELFKATSFGAKSNSLNVKSAPTTTTVVGGTGTLPGGGTTNPWNPGGWGVFGRPWFQHEPWTGLKPYSEGNNWNNWTYHTSVGGGYFRAENTNTSNYGMAGISQGTSYGVGKKEKNVHNNFYEKSAFIEIGGTNNFVGPRSSSIKIMGNQNQFGSAVKNVSVVGNNNYVEAGVTNTTVVGDNLYVTKSNAAYIGGAVIENGYLGSDINYINGGVNEVQNPFKSSVNGNLIKCGYNAVQNIGGMSNINLIASSQDNGDLQNRS